MKMHSSMAHLQSQFRSLSQVVLVAIAALTLWVGLDTLVPQSAAAYPFYAQYNYDSPREATGKIVCANCHLAKKTVEIEVPQAVLPDTVFKAVVKVPYDLDIQQVQADGSPSGLNVGAVLMLPEGFKLAPPERVDEELMEEVGDFYYLVTPYSETDENILLAGPLPGEDYQEMIFPILSPNPATDAGVYFGKYSIHLGGNRGRGQVYPTGELSNNNAFSASIAGTIAAIEDNGFGFDVTIQPEDGDAVVTSILPGPELIVAVGDTVEAGQLLTTNPNVGGFGQMDSEIVLQSSSRIWGLVAFFFGVVLTQIFLVLKKKQIEKVQLAEMNF
ncbi:apocytochrome f [Prochlorothrix hollandica]|uniref:Cytochrome f n=2 Tax=Prochlorothrix hollandica TaxID=1223 RepID=A0A0M2PVK5_PROHO|nr:apocytochrome f [Prochlorothrix hollandica PCC 9006 = CALU 1027]